MSGITPSDSHKDYTIPADTLIKFKSKLRPEDTSIAGKIKFIFKNVANIFTEGSTLYDEVRTELTSKMLDNLGVNRENKELTRRIMNIATAWVDDLAEGRVIHKTIKVPMK